MKTKVVVISCFALASVMGCSHPEDPVSLRADLVPLKMMMTDYVFADREKKLIKIECSANYVVPLSAHEPHLDGKCFRYTDLPCPELDMLSLRIDGQKILINKRGLLTSRSADSERINELRAKAVKAIKEYAEQESFVRVAKKNTIDALRAFYEKFDGYSCSVQWK